MGIRSFYNFTDYFTSREIALRDNFWGPRIPKKNIPSPNFLTIVRFVGAIILLCFLYFSSIEPTLFFSIVIILFLTDYFDGILARTQKKETTFGIWMDPIADRLLLLSVLYFLFIKNSDFWMGTLFKIIVPEIIILVLGMILFFSKKSILPNPNAWGRIKCFFYFFAVILFLFDYQYLAGFSIVIGLIFSYISIIGYSSRLVMAPYR